MKKVFAVCAIAFMAAGFTSCKKCGHCDVNGVEGAEVCGNASEIDDAETACEAVGGDWHAE